MTTIDRDYFASLPDKEMEAKPIVRVDVDGGRMVLTTRDGHVRKFPPDKHTESIPAALNDAMRTWIVVGILGLCVISFGVLMVVFGGGK